MAAAHRRHLVGKKFNATSPNGRFKEGAAVIHQQELKKIEVVGKNLYYTFAAEREKDEALSAHSLSSDVNIMHVHFGMSGRFPFYESLPGPDVKATTR